MKLNQKQQNAIPNSSDGIRSESNMKISAPEKSIPLGRDFVGDINSAALDTTCVESGSFQKEGTLDALPFHPGEFYWEISTQQLATLPRREIESLLPSRIRVIRLPHQLSVDLPQQSPCTEFEQPVLLH